jgi:hypothetical protein
VRFAEFSRASRHGSITFPMYDHNVGDTAAGPAVVDTD